MANIRFTNRKRSRKRFSRDFQERKVTELDWLFWMFFSILYPITEWLEKYSLCVMYPLQIKNQCSKHEERMYLRVPNSVLPEFLMGCGQRIDVMVFLFPQFLVKYKLIKTSQWFIKNESSWGVHAEGLGSWSPGKEYGLFYIYNLWDFWAQLMKPWPQLLVISMSHIRELRPVQSSKKLCLLVNSVYKCTTDSSSWGYRKIWFALWVILMKCWLSVCDSWHYPNC